MSNGATHVAFGICVGLTIVSTSKYISPDPIVYAGVGSLLSDFDSRNSTISNLFPFIGNVIDAFTKHRGILHWGTPIALIVAYMYTKHNVWLWISIGSASHYGLDMLTQLFGIKCNSVGERWLYKFIWIINICMIVNIVDPSMIDRIMGTVNNFVIK